MIGIVLAAVLKVGYILICKVIVVIIFVVLAKKRKGEPGYSRLDLSG